MMSNLEIVTVVTAHEEGKQIQWRNADYRFAQKNTWEDIPINATMVWDFVENDYRVAPESHLLKGYCFPKDIHQAATIGMVKVEQVPLVECPLVPRKA